MQTPQQGADTSIYLSLSRDIANIGGQYYDNCQAVPSSPASYDARLQQDLWDWSCEVTQLPCDIQSDVNVHYTWKSWLW